MTGATMNLRALSDMAGSRWSAEQLDIALRDAEVQSARVFARLVVRSTAAVAKTLSADQAPARCKAAGCGRASAQTRQ